MFSHSKLGSGLCMSLLVGWVPAIASILFFRWHLMKNEVVEIVVEPLADSTAIVEQSNNSLLSFEHMKDIYAENCPKHDYTVRMFSQDPLIIYVEDFISERERSYMVNLAEEHYQQSMVSDDDNIDMTSEDRTSQSAFIYFDPVSDCVRQRAASFQGGVPLDNIEELQAVKYHVGKQYKNHYDWGSTDTNPRVSTFFVYAACDQSVELFTNSTRADPLANQNLALTSCEGGATNFPEYGVEIPEPWCDVVDCEDEDQLGGVSFRAIPGNAVFWSNVHPNGTYHEGTLHAGVPVKSGTKVGLNIWTRKYPLISEADTPTTQELDTDFFEESEDDLFEEF